MDVVFLARRILFALIFIASGMMGHLVGRREAVEYARTYNAPAPDVMVPLSGVAIILGGLSIAFGVLADIGALIVATFVLSVAPIMHAFWKEQDPQQQQNQMAHFMKNMAMLEGALVIFFIYNQLQGDAPLSLTDPLFGRG
jgi:putative oxidoreductase